MVSEVLLTLLVAFVVTSCTMEMIRPTHGPNSNHVRKTKFMDNELGITYMLEPFPVLCPV